MHVNSAGYYFMALALMVLAGGLLNRVLPMHRRLAQEEIASGRILSLDGLRGILAISVFFHHGVLLYFFLKSGSFATSQLSAFYAQMGYLPVCMFFFITGYLFWLKLMKRPSFPALPFLYGRLARLGVAYWTACLFLFLLTILIGGFHRNVSLLKLLLQGFGWLSFLGGGHDLNLVADSKQWLGQVWTLQFEWYFYLTLPFLGWFARKRLRLVLLLASAALLELLFSRINVHGPATTAIKNIVVSHLSFIAYTFSVGMIVAAIPFSKRAIEAATSKPAAILCLAMMGAVAFFLQPSYGGWESLLLFLPFLCISQGNTWFGLLVSAPFRFLGRISYSLYLFHSLVLTLGSYFLVRHFSTATMSATFYWAFLCACGFVTLLVSAFSYQFLEHPFLHVGRSLPAIPRKTTQPALAGRDSEAVVQGISLP